MMKRMCIESKFKSLVARGQRQTYPKDIAQAMHDFAEHSALSELAKRRLDTGDYRGAASTCMKLLGEGGMQAVDWLLFAEIHATYGDASRARQILKKAVDTNRKAEIRREAVLLSCR